jgi:hypothetical protein
MRLSTLCGLHRDVRNTDSLPFLTGSDKGLHFFRKLLYIERNTYICTLYTVRSTLYSGTQAGRLHVNICMYVARTYAVRAHAMRTRCQMLSACMHA